MGHRWGWKLVISMKGHLIYAQQCAWVQATHVHNLSLYVVHGVGPTGHQINARRQPRLAQVLLKCSASSSMADISKATTREKYPVWPAGGSGFGLVLVWSGGGSVPCVTLGRLCQHYPASPPPLPPIRNMTRALPLFQLQPFYFFPILQLFSPSVLKVRCSLSRKWRSTKMFVHNNWSHDIGCTSLRIRAFSVVPVHIWQQTISECNDHIPDGFSQGLALGKPSIFGWWPCFFSILKYMCLCSSHNQQTTRSSSSAQ